jgi:hypothetical protein
LNGIENVGGENNEMNAEEYAMQSNEREVRL